MFDEFLVPGPSEEDGQTGRPKIGEGTPGTSFKKCKVYAAGYLQVAVKLSRNSSQTP